MRIFIFTLILIQFPLYSQSYFYKISKDEKSAAHYQCINYKNRYFIFTTKICDNGKECCSVNEIDSHGNVIWGINLQKTDIGIKSNLISHDTLYVSGNYSLDNGKSIINRLDLDGKLLSENIVLDVNKRFDRSFILNLNIFKEKLILSGNCFIDERNKGMLMVLNSDLEVDTVLVDTTLELSTIWDSFVGTDSLFTTFYYKDLKFWPNQVRRIIKYDADFNQVWTYTSDTLGVNTSFPYGTVLRDGRLAFVDFKPLQNTGLNSLRSLDTITKKNDWMFSYQNIQSWGRKLRSVKQLKNGDIICTGEYTTKSSEPRINGSPYMMRLDINGNLLWERAYVEIDTDGEDKGGNLWDVIELDNGDLMAVGFVTNDRKWDPLIIRTDHQGCMDGGNTNCPTVRIIDLTSGTEDVINGDIKTKIYPNPTDQQSFTVEISDFDSNARYHCTILDIYGKVISQHTISQNKQEIDLHNIVAGLYIVKITNLDKILLVEKLIVR